MNTCDECKHFDFNDFKVGESLCTCKKKHNKHVGFGEEPCEDFEEAEDE